MNRVLTISQQVCIFSMYQIVAAIQCKTDLVDNKRQDSFASLAGLGNLQLAKESN
jgi:hypothetical protein